MKIQFVIRESLSEIIDQLSNSNFWVTEVKGTAEKKIIKIKDLIYPLAATAEVSPHEIVIHTAISNFTYRIFEVGKAIYCEYTGAFRGLLEHKLMPHLTPVGNIMDYEVKESSLLDAGRHVTLREYARYNCELRKKRDEMAGKAADIPCYVPKAVCGDFFKEDAPCN